MYSDKKNTLEYLSFPKINKSPTILYSYTHNTFHISYLIAKNHFWVRFAPLRSSKSQQADSINFPKTALEITNRQSNAISIFCNEIGFQFDSHCPRTTMEARLNVENEATADCGWGRFSRQHETRPSQLFILTWKWNNNVQYVRNVEQFGISWSANWKTDVHNCAMRYAYNADTHTWSVIVHLDLHHLQFIRL